ncbi:MAG: hypothetical protein ACRDCD_01710, partial [Mycoplasmoidaceae bacterium]
MNKKIKLSLLGTLVAGSALAITLPIVSCSGSTSEDQTITNIVGVDGISLTNTEFVVNVGLKDELSS